MIDADKVYSLAMKATRGQWEVELETCDCEYPCGHIAYPIGLKHSCYDDMPDEDFHFIAAACPDAIIELITQLREAEKDAARYRWLRNCTTVESKKFVSDSGGWIVGLGVLDGMIDQAMKEKGDE